mmetsp:Transcript_92024/g.187318  ORF Transcript_92024/g.187318 Transcript_92024/m.187318 type:complete len:126 (+) Transcript_92024:1528-1905(+)
MLVGAIDTGIGKIAFIASLTPHRRKGKFAYCRRAGSAVFRKTYLIKDLGRGGVDPTRSRFFFIVVVELLDNLKLKNGFDSADVTQECAIVIMRSMVPTDSREQSQTLSSSSNQQDSFRKILCSSR